MNYQFFIIILHFLKICLIVSYNILCNILLKLLKLNVKTESNNSSSKLALDLQKEIKRRKLDKNPIKFESKLKIALKEVLNRRRKMKTN